MSKEIKIIRHGDLAFKRIAKIPSGLKKVSYNGNFSLQEGETTGHHHRLVADKKDVELMQDQFGNYYISINGKAVMSHPEHKTIEIPKGTWKLDHEKEKDWFSLEVRQVVD